VQVYFDTPAVVAMTDIPTTSEVYRKLFNSDAMKATIPTFLEIGMIYAKLQATWGLPVEKARLLCGEYLHALFWTYRAFIGSVALHLANGRDTGDLQPWWEYDHTLSLLRSALDPDEFEDFEALKGGRYTWVVRNLEAKFLKAAGDIIDGRRAATDATEQALVLLAAAKDSLKEQQK
jgi:hypothetical protein